MEIFNNQKMSITSLKQGHQTREEGVSVSDLRLSENQAMKFLVRLTQVGQNVFNDHKKDLFTKFLLALQVMFHCNQL